MNFGPLSVAKPSVALGIVGIVLALIAGLLSAAGQPGGPLVGQWWIGPVVAAITALAALLKENDGG